MAETPNQLPNAFDPVSYETWRERVDKDLKGKPFERLRTRVSADIEVEPLYSQKDDLGADASGFPGVAPFVRGTAPLGQTESGWALCQEYEDPRMEVAAKAIETDLARGAGAVWVRVGLDHGVRVLTAGDLETVLGAVDLETLSVQLEPGVDAIPAAASLIAVANKRGVPVDKLNGGFGADPIAALMINGGLPSGFRGAMRELTDLAAYSAHNTPGLRAALVSSDPYHDAGADPVQELAWAIATGTLYLRSMVEAGLSVEEAAKEIRFALSVSGEFFPQIAKLRAARWLWSKVVAAAGGSDEAQAMSLHARTSAFTKTRRDPWVNMLRITAETAAAAIGGAESVAAGTFDEAIGPRDDFSRRVSRNTQMVLRDESYLHRVADPAGGSWFIEQLTDKLARAAWERFQAIEATGGMFKEVIHGRVGKALAATRAQREKDLATRKTSIIGVNEFASLTEAPVERRPVDLAEVEGELGNPFGNATPEERHERLLGFARVVRSKADATGGEMLEAATAAVATGVDLFSLTAVLRDGEPSLHVEPIVRWRQCDSWESLRDASDEAQKQGANVSAFLCNLGPIPAHKARSMWTANLLAAGGISAAENDGFADAGAALPAYAEAGAPPVVVLVGKDDAYDDAMSHVLAFKEAGAKVIALAGKVKDQQEAYRAAGVDHFLFAGGDAIATLRAIHRAIGVNS